jgi:death-on-curing protein
MSQPGEPRWLTAEHIILAHERQMRRYGGAAGLRERGLLESALLRAENKWRYEALELPDLAAAYAVGLVKNHPFVDGNKRMAFLAMTAFLRRNGVPFAPPQPTATAIILALAAGEVSEQSLARWISDNWPPAGAAPMRARGRP